MKKPSARSFNLKVRKGLRRTLIDFPRVKGRTVEKIQFFTTAESHSITIIFQDKFALNLNLTPKFTLEAEFENRKPDSLKITKRWPPIDTQH